MRKRNFSFCLDNFFWYVIYFMPIIFYCFAFLSHVYTPPAFDVFFEFIGVDVATTQTYGVLLDIFGTSGVMPLFDSPEIFTVLAWFINCVIVHLAVDFLLFIPRLAHKWLGALTQND